MRIRRKTVVTALAILLAVTLSLGAASACKPKMVTVRTGEVLLCTEGHVISDSTEETEVKAREVANYSVTTEVTTCELHQKAADLYDQAQKAIEKGDLAAAEKALAELATLDPAYRNVQAQLRDVRDGETPEPAAEAPEAPADPADEDPENPDTQEPAPVAGLAKYVPDELPGYVAQGILADPFVITRDYLPDGNDDVLVLVIVAEQYLDEEAALASLDANTRTWYSDAGDDIDIAGKTGYFGVREGSAAAAFVDGSIVVTVELRATDIEDAQNMRDEVVRVAEEVAN